MALYKIDNVKKLSNLLSGHKYICFLDFEGTQFSHEMIAYGAVLASLKKDGTIKNHKEPIKVYVKAKNKVGKFVEQLTGITDYTLQHSGVSFLEAMKQLKKYCGLHFSKCLFVTFGNHDLKILNQSIAYSLDAPKDITTYIHKGFFDYQAFISNYCRDEANNPYSLENYLNVYNVKFEGTAHDPRYDALNLMYLYDAFLKNKEITVSEYLKVLAKTNHIPAPIKKVVEKLSRGENITSEEYIQFVKDDIQ